eukprot:767568-Pleurochrysis_carterae.AAC.2
MSVGYPARYSAVLRGRLPGQQGCAPRRAPHLRASHARRERLLVDAEQSARPRLCFGSLVHASLCMRRLRLHASSKRGPLCYALRSILLRCYGTDDT